FDPAAFFTEGNEDNKGFEVHCAEFDYVAFVSFCENQRHGLLAAAPQPAAARRTTQKAPRMAKDTPRQMMKPTASTLSHLVNSQLEFGPKSLLSLKRPGFRAVAAMASSSSTGV